MEAFDLIAVAAFYLRPTAIVATSEFKTVMSASRPRRGVQCALSIVDCGAFLVGERDQGEHALQITILIRGDKAQGSPPNLG